MDDDKATKSGGGTVLAVVLVAVLVVLPMTYVLSTGPVVGLVAGGYIDPAWLPTVEVAYGPLEWVAINVPGVGHAIQGYVDWWVPEVEPIYVTPPAATNPAPASPLAAASGS